MRPFTLACAQWHWRALSSLQPLATPGPALVAAGHGLQPARALERCAIMITSPTGGERSSNLEDIYRITGA